MVKRRTGLGAALACLATLAVSACTQTSDGTPSPTSGTPATGSVAPGPTSGAAKTTETAPPITNPLDVSKFIADACLSLTPDQADSLTISPQGRWTKTGTGSACGWPYGTTHEISVSYITPDAKNGLQNLYNQRAAGWYGQGYFEPTTIDGYPAVYEDPTDYRQKGECSLSLGINQQTLVNVVNQGEFNKDLCPGAVKVANAVVETIKRG